MGMMRVRFVLEVCALAGKARDGRPSSGDVLKESGLSPRVLTKKYSPGPEALERLTTALAELWQEDIASFRCAARKEGEREEAKEATGEAAPNAKEIERERLALWFAGGRDKELDRFWDLERWKVKCTGTGPHANSAAALPEGWFHSMLDADRLVAKKRGRPNKCKRCEARDATPETADWAQTVAGMIKAMPRKYPAKLRQAFMKIFAAGGSPGYKGMADEAKTELREFRRAWNRSGLPKKPRGGVVPNQRIMTPLYPLWMSVLWQLLLGGTAEAAGAATSVGGGGIRNLVVAVGVQFAIYTLSAERMIRSWVRRWVQEADRLRQLVKGRPVPSLGEPAWALGVA